MYLHVRISKCILISICVCTADLHYCLFIVLSYKCICGVSPGPSKSGTDQSRVTCVWVCARTGMNLCVSVALWKVCACGGIGCRWGGGCRFLIYRPQAAFEALISSHHIVQAHPLVQQGAENSPCNMVPPHPPHPFLSLTSHSPVPELADWQPT